MTAKNTKGQISIEPMVTTLVWDVPQDLKQMFKAKCVRKGISMRKALIDFMKDFVETA